LKDYRIFSVSRILRECFLLCIYREWVSVWGSRGGLALGLRGRGCFARLQFFLVFVDSPFEDLQEGVLLSDSSVVVVVVEPEAWGARSGRAGSPRVTVGSLRVVAGGHS
jgi:hypothetical protein